jgi:hypothetical protein
MSVGKRTWFIPFALAAAAALAVAAAPAAREWFAVDACLDGGGCWVRSSSRCEYTTQADCSR